MSTKIVYWHGLPAVLLQNPHAECIITLHGAHVVSYIPAQMEELLFISKCSDFADGKAIRGGIPICFPWFGAPPQGECNSHGLVRTTEWELLDADAYHAVFGLDIKGFRLRCTVTAAEKLEIILHIENISEHTLHYSGALHTYFKVTDASAVTLTGINGVSYLDSLTGKTGIQSVPLRIDREIDRVYKSADPVTLDDPIAKRRIKAEKSGSNSTVIWNPWIAKSQRMPDFGDDEYPQMLCIESANVPATGDSRTLAPGESSLLAQVISIQNY